MRWHELYADAQGLQDRKDLAHLAGRLTVFQVADKAQTGARGEGEVGLCDADLLARLPDDLAELFRC